MNTWNELRARLDKNQTIDKNLQQEVIKERENVGDKFYLGYFQL